MCAFLYSLYLSLSLYLYLYCGACFYSVFRARVDVVVCCARVAARVLFVDVLRARRRALIMFNDVP